MKVIIELDNDMLKEIKEGDFEVSRKIVRSFQATISDSIRNGEPIPDGAASKKCHAHWIEGQTDNPNIHNILCSHCFGGYPSKGHANSQYTKKRFKWCPSCGAKMDDERDLPPVTPAHKTGRWIRKPIRNDKGGCVGAKMICTCCGKDNECGRKLNYCPSCGAKIESEEK